MRIGICKENVHQEKRVALTPATLRQLVENGHTVFFERGAGEGAHFTDEEFLNAGGSICFSHHELVGRSDLLLKVMAPTMEECGDLRRDQIVMAFFHLAIAPKDLFQNLIHKEITAVGYEIIETLDGSLPVLLAISEIAGPMSILIAASLLQSNSGGRGVLLGGAPGITPANVVILGAGEVGTGAAQTAMANGANVMVLDADTNKLRRLVHRLGNRVVTSIADRYNIERAVKFADVLIGAVLIHGGKAPHLVTRSMVDTMKPGSVIIDVSIDQGGCVETSRPTTLAQPTYIYHDIIHYCVPNFTANVARTASISLSNASFPYVVEIANHGIEHALRHRLELAHGIYTYRGVCTNRAVADIFDAKYSEIDALLGEFIWS